MVSVGVVPVGVVVGAASSPESRVNRMLPAISANATSPATASAIMRLRLRPLPGGRRLRNGGINVQVCLQVATLALRTG